MIRRVILLLATTAALAACGQGIDNAKLRVDVIEPIPRPLMVGALPLPQASAYLRSATAQGLVGFDMEGRVAPGLASRWIVTDDNLSYIFRLDKIRWSDGREINSDQVAQALSSRFRELRNSRFGPDLAEVTRIVPMTGKVIEIRLAAPMPNFLEMLAQPEFGIARNNAGTGPMQARKLGSMVELQLKGLNEKGEPVLENEHVRLRSARTSMALARFLDGKTDLVTGGRFEDLPLLDAANVASNEVFFDPIPGLFGFIAADSGPFMSNAANREAITMAIDRPRMLTSFDIVWREALTLAPETIRNREPIDRPEWVSSSIDDRKNLARTAIAKWESGNGDVRPLRIALPAGPGARILFAMLRIDLADIGLQAVRVGISDPADLRLVDRPADMSGQSWYLSQLSCDNSPICSEHADALVAEARNSPDLATRSKLLAEAETELQRTRNFIPIAAPLRWSVARQGLLGFAINRRGFHPLQYLGRDPT